MLQVTSITPVGGIQGSPTTIQISDDPDIAYREPQKIYINFNYSNNTGKPVFIFLEGNGLQIVTGSFFYDTDNDPLTNPGFQSRDGSGDHYAFRYRPGQASNLVLYMQQTDADGNYGAIVERIEIPGHYLYIGSSSPNPNPKPSPKPSLERLSDLAIRSQIDKSLKGFGHVFDYIIGNKTITLPSGETKKDWWGGTVGSEVIDLGLKILEKGSKAAIKLVPWLKGMNAAVEFGAEVLDRANATGKPWYNAGIILAAGNKALGNALFPGLGDAIVGIIESEAAKKKKELNSPRSLHELSVSFEENQIDRFSLNRSPVDQFRRTRSNESVRYFFGENGNDILKGRSTNDVIIGKNGSDVLVGGDGFDQLNGTGSKFGRGEIDKLIGGEGVDLFVLGNSQRVFYDDGNRRSRGEKDYALITDFDPVLDGILLRGSASNYVFKSATGGGQYICLDNDGIFGKSRNDEIIAHVKGSVRLNVSDVAFI